MGFEPSPTPQTNCFLGNDDKEQLLWSGQYRLKFYNIYK